MVLCYCKKPENHYFKYRKSNIKLGWGYRAACPTLESGTSQIFNRHCNNDDNNNNNNNNKVNIFIKHYLYFYLKPTAIISAFYNKSLLTCVRIQKVANLQHMQNCKMLRPQP